MTWREFGDFLHLQRCAINPRPISEFARIGEKAADTFRRLEKTTRGPLDEAVPKGKHSAGVSAMAIALNIVIGIALRIRRPLMFRRVETTTFPS